QHDRVDVPRTERGGGEQFPGVVQAGPGRHQVAGAERAQRVERGRDDEQDREQGEGHRTPQQQVPPGVVAQPAEEGAVAVDGGGHRFTSARERLCLRLISDSRATIRKISTETAEANPYWAPWPPNANRKV